jgi:hypothetical protein
LDVQQLAFFQIRIQYTPFNHTQPIGIHLPWNDGVQHLTTETHHQILKDDINICHSTLKSIKESSRCYLGSKGHSEVAGGEKD